MTRQAGCPHRWLIESPNGPTSRGRCLLCGAKREFSNWATPTRTPSRAERNLIARVRREEGAMTELVHNFGRDRPLTLDAYRRNLRRGD